MISEANSNKNPWDDFWKGITPSSEIQMWDYFGGRQWVTKYTSRFGKVVEAGCGAGRYNFYLKKLGIDIDGIDSSEKLIESLNEIKNNIEPKASFKVGDVTQLPYEDNELSGYISLGVIEHFINGPHEALNEAYRVLKPGGVAIITTPNKSFYQRYKRTKKGLKNAIKRIIGKEILQKPFFQYEYSPTQLKRFCKKAGFHISRAEGFDLLYPFNEIGGFKGFNLKPGSFPYWFSHNFEHSPLNRFGGQSVVIAVKPGPKMQCFISGEFLATLDSLNRYDVPISLDMQSSALAKLFERRRKVTYGTSYTINPPIQNQEIRQCDFSGEKYETDPIFENYGFTKNVSPKLLKNKEINMKLCVKYIRPVWRPRI